MPHQKHPQIFVPLPDLPPMISDGVRPRQIWVPADGYGDPSSNTVARSINTLRGHPTWKIFCRDVPLPLIRDTPTEPPHYVYLDDAACHAIYCSGVYNKIELRKYWPWDFDHLGNIKQDRRNRGRPAFLDDSRKSYATAPRRKPAAPYVFSGEPQEVAAVREMEEKEMSGQPKETVMLPGNGKRLNLGVSILRRKTTNADLKLNPKGNQHAEGKMRSAPSAYP
ncbi:hypothetical protein BCR34DRAFT_599038 [Clohesyomyces aquaticus]|uniref:Uncharacterized protein n=1 Tax=Clohesyomyces aquaticus TaxID=1231657 RepID=A0A1Y1ZWT1_9PLEO|nr:hypothetical protein BCR34DRAFT_599038 [Clohesyomyces aquaticus]